MNLKIKKHSQLCYNCAACEQTKPMSKKIKKLVTTVFVLFVIFSFAALTIIVIIIAQGGKVTPAGIEKTGTIRIDVQPDNGLEVFVDNIETDLNDKRIDSLEPGTYEIRIEKEDFTSWTKKVEVEQGVVTELSATLFPKDLELEQITTSNIDRAFFSPDGSYVVYTITKADPADNGIWKLKLTQNTFGLIENKPEKITPITALLKGIIATEYEITISQDNDKFILNNEVTQLLYRLNNGQNPVILDSVDNVGFIADNLTWFEQGDSLILEKDESIYEYVLSDNSTRYIYSFESEPVYAVNGRTLIFYANNKYYTYSSQKKELLEVRDSIKLPAPEKLWLSQNNDKHLYIQSAGKLHFANLEESIHNIGAYAPLNVSPHGNAALVLDTNNALFIFRNEYIPAKDVVATNLALVKENYNLQTTLYSWSPDSAQVIEKNVINMEKTVALTDNYGENTYEILNTDQIQTDDYYLANDSSDFLILLADSSSQNEPQEKSYNLYKIRLID